MPEQDWDAPVTLTMRRGNAAAVVQGIGYGSNLSGEALEGAREIDTALSAQDVQEEKQCGGSGKSGSFLINVCGDSVQDPCHCPDCSPEVQEGPGELDHFGELDAVQAAAANVPAFEEAEEKIGLVEWSALIAELRERGYELTPTQQHPPALTQEALAALDHKPYKRSGAPVDDYQTGFDAGIDEARKLLRAQLERSSSPVTQQHFSHQDKERLEEIPEAARNAAYQAVRAVAKGRSHYAPEPDSVGVQQFARAAVDAMLPYLSKRRLSGEDGRFRRTMEGQILACREWAKTENEFAAELDGNEEKSHLAKFRREHASRVLEDVKRLEALLSEGVGEDGGLRELLTSDAAIHALYCHAPHLSTDDDGGPNEAEEGELRDALSSVADVITEQPDPTQQPGQEDNPKDCGGSGYVRGEDPPPPGFSTPVPISLHCDGCSHPECPASEDQEGEDDWPEVWLVRRRRERTPRERVYTTEASAYDLKQNTEEVRRYLPAPDQGGEKR